MIIFESDYYSEVKRRQSLKKIQLMIKKKKVIKMIGVTFVLKQSHKVHDEKW